MHAYNIFHIYTDTQVLKCDLSGNVWYSRVAISAEIGGSRSKNSQNAKMSCTSINDRP